jgi:hypothetical protein
MLTPCDGPGTAYLQGVYHFVNLSYVSDASTPQRGLLDSMVYITHVSV